MLSVLEVEKKRQKLRPLPPGLHNTQPPKNRNSISRTNKKSQSRTNKINQPPNNENSQSRTKKTNQIPKHEISQAPKIENSKSLRNKSFQQPQQRNRHHQNNKNNQPPTYKNSQPPRSENNQLSNNENNNSKVIGCGACTCHIRVPPRVTAEKGLITRVHMEDWKPEEVDSGSPMMPVEHVNQKRSKFKSDPPGFHTIQKVDLNNNSKESGKLTSKLNRLGASFWEKVSGKASREESENNQSNLTSSLGSNLKDMGSNLKDMGFNLIDMGINLKDRGFNFTDFGFGLKDLLNLYASKDKAGHIKCPTHTQEIVGVVATVNHLEAIGSDDVLWTYTLDDRLSPENYGETVRYYDDEIDARQNILRAIYVLGDMLVTDELEGDKDAWIEYTQKCVEEERAWKAKCKASQALFDKSRRVLGKKESFFQRSRHLLSDITQKVMNACPCLFGK